MQQNILGVDYFLLMSFLWLVAGVDFQLSRSSIMIRAFGKSIDTRVLLFRFAFFVLWFMAAFRGLDVTNDLQAYYRMYSEIATLGPDNIKRIEVGYVLLNVIFSKIIKNTFIGFRALILFTTTISYSAVEQWIEKHARSYGICLIAYYYLVNSSFMSANRQMLAAGIVLWSLMYLEKSKFHGKLIIYVLMVLLASTFHQSAIICVLFPILDRLKLIRYMPIWILLATVFLTGTNAVTIIVTKIGIGTGYLTADVGNVTNVAVNSFLYIALLMLRVIEQNDIYKLKGKDDKSCFQESFYTYCIILTLSITIMSLRAPGMSRIAMYFQIAGIPYISNTIIKIKSAKTKFIIKLTFGLAIWAYSAISLVYRPEWQHLWPYHFFWE